MKRKTPYELHIAMLDSTGMAIANRIESLSFSYRIFKGNLQELEKALTVIETPEIAFLLWAEKNADKLQQVHKEIIRYFHNYLAGAKSLVDHTRIFIKEYYRNSQISHEYESRVKAEFASDPFTQFVQDLRNYMLHKGIPSTQMGLKVSKDNPPDCSVFLSLSVLRDWDRWNKFSKKYLMSLTDEKLRLKNIVQDYGRKVSQFYDWLLARLLDVHKNDLLELDKMQRQYAEAIHHKDNKNDELS
jgi:hypothetical protein